MPSKTTQTQNINRAALKLALAVVKNSGKATHLVSHDQVEAAGTYIKAAQEGLAELIVEHPSSSESHIAQEAYRLADAAYSGAVVGYR